MSYNYPLPDGTFISVPNNTPTSVAEQWARRDFPELYKAQTPKKEESGFFANVKGGYRDLMANNALGIGALGDEQAAREASRTARSANDNIRTTSWEDVKNAKGVGDTLSTAAAFARDSLGQTAPYMGQTMLGARTGAALGSMVAPGVGTAIGAGLGGLAANIPAMFGSNLERQDKESPNTPFDKTSAATAAVAQSALDATSTLFLFGRMAGINKLAGEALPKLFKKPADEVERKLIASAQQSLLKAAGKGAVEGAVVEMPTELAQQVLERAQAGLALTGPEANKEYEATLAGAAAVGGLAGPVHSVMERGAARGKLADRDKAAADQARALAASQEQEKIQTEEAFKKTPDYLTKLDADYAARVKQLDEMTAAINAFGKPAPESAEALLKKKARDERAAYIKSTAQLAEDYAAKKKDIGALKAKQAHDALDPMQYMIDNTEDAGIRGYAPGQRPTFTDQQQEVPSEAGPAKQKLTSMVAGLQNSASITGEKLEKEDYIAHLQQAPNEVALAVQHGFDIPGISKSYLRQAHEHNQTLGKLIAAERESTKAAQTKADAEEVDHRKSIEDANNILEALRTKPTSPTVAVGEASPVTKEEAKVDPAADTRRTDIQNAKEDYEAVLALYKFKRMINSPEAAGLRGQVEAARQKLDEAVGGTNLGAAANSLAPGAPFIQGNGEPIVMAPVRADILADLDKQIKLLDDQVKAASGKKALQEEGQLTEHGRKVALAQSMRDDLIAQRSVLRSDAGKPAATPPKTIDYSGIDELLDRALAPTAQGKPASAEELEAGVMRLIDIRKGLLNKYVSAIDAKASLEDALSRIPDNEILTVKGRDVETTGREAAKRARAKQAATEARQAKAELVAAAVEEIKRNRELLGLVPLTVPDARLAAQISHKVDERFANKSPKRNGVVEPSSNDADLNKINDRLAYIQARIAKLEQNAVTESDYAELRQLDAEEVRLDASKRNIKKPFKREDTQRQVAIQKQLDFINRRLQELGGSAEKEERRVTGAATPYGVSAEKAGEYKRLINARRNLVAQQGVGWAGAQIGQQLQRVVDYYTVGKGQGATRANQMRKAADTGTGRFQRGEQAPILRERQYPGREVQTGSTEFGKAYAMESGVEQFSPTAEDTALVKRMREEEIQRLNDAAQDPRYDAKQQTRIDDAILALQGKLADPATQDEVARAKEKFGSTDTDTETGDIFKEGLPKAVDEAGAAYNTARTAATEGKSAFGKALSGVRGKTLDAYTEAKATLDEIRAKLAKLTKEQDAARRDVFDAAMAKIDNEKAEADAKLRDTQRTVAAAIKRIKQKRDAKASPEEKFKLSDDEQTLLALMRELRDELQPQLAALSHVIDATPELKRLQQFFREESGSIPTPGALVKNRPEQRETLAQMRNELVALIKLGREEKTRTTAAGIAEFQRLVNRLSAEVNTHTRKGIEAGIAGNRMTETIAQESASVAALREKQVPVRKKIAAVVDAIEAIKKQVKEKYSANKPLMETVTGARKAFDALELAKTRAYELRTSLRENGMPEAEIQNDQRVKDVRQEIEDADKAYKAAIGDVETHKERNASVDKYLAEAEKRYEASWEREQDRQRRLEAVYGNKIEKENAGKYEVTKPFGVAKEKPVPQKIKGSYGTAYNQATVTQTDEARAARAEKRLEAQAESGAPAIRLDGEKEMRLEIPEDVSTEARAKIADWLEKKGWSEAAAEVRDDADAVTLKMPKLKESQDVGKVIEQAQAQMAAAIRMGGRETQVRPQKTKANTALKTGAKRGRKTNEAALNERLGLGPMSDGDPDVVFRTSKTERITLDPGTAQQVMTAFLKEAPQDIKTAIEFYPSEKDVPAKRVQEIRDAGGIGENGALPHGGLLSDGKILVIGDTHKNVAHLMETLAHEITGHYGVRKLLGKEGISKLTQRLANQGLIESTAKVLGVEEGLKEARETSREIGESPQKANERAVQEILAHLEEKRPTENTLQKISRFVHELMGAINAALAEMGLRSPYKVTPSDLYHILRQARNEIGVNAVANDTVFRKAKSTHTNAAVGDAADAMIGGRNRDKLAEIRGAATGLSMRTRFVDNYAALKEALKRGDAAPAIQVTYDLMNYAQRNHFVQQAVTVGAPTRAWWGKEGGKDVYKTEAQEGASMKRVSELLSKVEGFGDAQATSDAFTLYALAKRAKTEGWFRVFADTPTALNATAEQQAEVDKINKRKAAARAEADKLADDANSPFNAAYKEYQDWNKGMLQFVQHAGVISEDEFRRLSSKQNYTPLFRSDNHGNLVLEIDQGRDITVGRLADEPHLQKLLGGDGQVMDFFTASVRNASVLIDAALHNVASREAAFALNAMDAAHPVAASEKGENIVEFRKDGVLQRFAVDTTGTKAADIPTALLVKGFAGVPASLPGFVRMMGVPAQVLRKAVTRNPLYMARQLIRDPVSAWLTTGAKFNPITDTLSEMSKSLSGVADKTLDRRGITGGALFSDDVGDLKRIQDEAQSEGRGWNIGYYMAKLDHAAHAADAITRRNVYNGAIKQGASEIQATLAAYESMPFSKRGTSPSVRYLNHMVPFMSAAIQGWDVLYRAAKGDMPLQDRVNIRNQLLARGSMIAGMTMLYALAMADDDEYKKANTSERLSNWFVTLPGTNQKVKLPVPFELGIIFKMLPEALVRIAYSDKDAGQELRDVGGALAGMVPNAVIPQAMIPLVEATLNKSFFTGNAIEGRTLEALDIGQRYDDKTSELSKKFGFNIDVLGKQVGLSPKMFEYVMSQYTAGLYPAMAALVDTLLPAPTSSKPDRKLAELPLFRSALLQEDAGGEVNRLYDKIDKFTKASATLKHLQETEPLKAQTYFEENKDAVIKGKMAGKMKAAIDKISNAENKIRNSNMSGEQKREALDNFKRIKSNLATQFGASL